jgi:predicted secreted protein
MSPVTQAIAGYGTSLTRDGHPIAELTKLSGPKKSADTIDVTNFGSPDSYREFIRGFKDGGEVGIEGNFIPGDIDGQAGLDEDYEAGTVQTFIMTFVNGTTWTFSAVVKDLGTDTPFDGKVGFSATLKVSGKPVLGVMLSDFLSGMDFEDSAGAKTSIPALADDTYTYSLTIDTDSSYIKITVTQEAAVTIVASCLGVSHNLTTGVQSGEIAVGDANTTTLLTVTASDTGKSPRVYTIYVVRP